MTNNTHVSGDELARIALQAGVIVMDVFRSDFDIEQKDDKSPVTLADQRAEVYITAELQKLAPDLTIIAEEAASEGHLPECGQDFALVDPLDGTRSFIEKKADFTVNIGIMHRGRPISGVVYAPARNRLWVADDPSSAWEAEVQPGEPVPSLDARKALSIRKCPSKGVTAVASRSHRSPETDAFLKKFTVNDIVSVGSSLKFCLVASGEADLYPRMGRTMEWDTAAGHAVAQAAGARVLTEDGLDLTYGKIDRGYDNPYFICYGDVEHPR